MCGRVFVRLRSRVVVETDRGSECYVGDVGVEVEDFVYRKPFVEKVWVDDERTRDVGEPVAHNLSLDNVIGNLQNAGVEQNRRVVAVDDPMSVLVHSGV